LEGGIINTTDSISVHGICAIWASLMDSINLISFRVKVLFDGHHDLILAFIEFLPEGYKINIGDGDEVA
jgi:hypothetical protein